MKKIVKSFSMTLMVVLCMVMLCSIKSEAIEKGSITWGQSFSGKEEASDEVYSFKLETSGKVAFTYTYKGAGNNRFIIQDKTGKDMLHLNVGDGTFNSSLDLLAGEYQLIIKSYMNWGGLEYSVIPMFESSEETNSESYLSKNNEVTTATTYAVGKNMKAQFAVNDDTDIYAVKLDKNGFLKLTLISELENMNFEIKNAMGDVSYSSNDVSVGKHVYSYFCPKGTYYVIFKSNKTGVYSFETARTDIPKTSVSKTTNLKNKRAKITWKRKSNVDGYQIQYSANKKFQKGNKSKTIQSATTSSLTIKNLKKNKKYYVRIRTYVKDTNGKKYYSGWSNAKSVKIRK